MPRQGQSHHRATYATDASSRSYVASPPSPSPTLPPSPSPLTPPCNTRPLPSITCITHRCHHHTRQLCMTDNKKATPSVKPPRQPALQQQRLPPNINMATRTTRGNACKALHPYAQALVAHPTVAKQYIHSKESVRMAVRIQNRTTQANTQ